MPSRLLLAAVLISLSVLPLAPRARILADARGPQSLSGLVASGSLTRDTNADGLEEAVAARVIVPANATLADIETATNLAARLGYETTALTLPLVMRDRDIAQPASIGVPILVGRTNQFVERLADAHAIDLMSLKPGQGLVAAVASPLGGGDGLVVVGGDDEGTVAAG